MEKSIKLLLDLITTFDRNEEKYLYEGIDKLFSENLNTKKVIFFSLPRHAKKLKDKTGIQQCRFLWNKKFLDKDYSKASFSKLIEKIMREAEDFTSWKVENDSYRFFLGKNKWQLFYMYFETDEKEVFTKEFTNYCCQYFQKTFEMCQRWRDVSKYKSLVYIDDVTGLYNQRKMIKDLQYCIERYEDLKEKFYVFFIDVDHFKQVNDGHGHLVGTQLLSELAKLLKNELRATDFVYRYGGDEYVAIVTDVDDGIAERVGQRILDNIKKTVFKVDDMGTLKEFELSVSIGIAGFPDDACNYKEILSLADRMMYEAKTGGRGTVCQARNYFNDVKKVAK